MGRPHSTAKKPQEFNEIVKQETEKKQSKIYKEQAVALADDKIASAITNTINELSMAKDQEPVTLTDTDSIKKLTIRYFTACEQTATLPNFSGLAHSMGLSRQALYDYCKRNPKSATAKWLDMVKDSMASILEESALRNNCNPVVSIFLLKSQYQYQDKQVIDVNASQIQTPLSDLPTIEEVEAKYSLDFIPQEDLI